MSAFGQWGQGPIQFGPGGVIQTRGTRNATSPLPGGDVGKPVVDMTGPIIDPVNPDGNPNTSGTGVLRGPNPSWGLPGGQQPVGGGFGSSSPSNGGSYGLTGGGFQGQGPGGFDDETGTAFLADGGVVPEDQGAGSATVDPMTVVAAAMKFGRGRFGLPGNFSTGGNEQEEQTFEDGGVVGEDGVIPEQGGQLGGGGSYRGGNSQMPDPRQAIKYLAGDGAVEPGIVRALEQRVDPQGTLDPAARTLATLGVAPNPEAAFGLMQHYRTLYNGHSGAARAAMSQGNLAQAAQSATNAFAAMPTGRKVKFAPTQGGIAMMAENIMNGGGQKPQQSFEDGGVVGEEDDFLAGVTPSENVEDRRDEDRRDPDDMDAYEAQMYNRRHGLDEGTQRLAGTREPQVTNWRRAWGRTADKLGAKFFADGGYVDDTEEEGVIPTTDMPSEGQNVMETNPAPAEEEAPQQPVILTPEQFEQMMTSGFDRPVDEGWDNFLQRLLSNINPIGSAEAAPAQQNGAPQPPRPQTPQPKTPGSVMDRTDPWTHAANAVSSLFGGGGQDVAAALSEGDPRNPDWAQGGAQPNRWQPTPFIMEAAAADRAARDRPPPPAAQPQLPNTDERWQAHLQRVEQLAQRLYPWASQEQQRNQYTQQMMQQFSQRDQSIDLEQHRGRGALEAQKEAARLARLQIQEQGRNDRAAGSQQNRLQIAVMRMNQQQQANLATQTRTLINGLRNNQPNITPQQIQEQLAPLLQRYNLDPRLAPDLLQQYQRSQGGGGGQQQPQPQQPPASGQSGNAPTLKFYQGKWYRRGPNGEAVVVQENGL